MIEDMRICGVSPKTQQAHIRAVRYFPEFIARSPNTATSDEVCAYQLHMTDSGVSIGVFNARIVSLRFFFGMTCGREEMNRNMRFPGNVVMMAISGTLRRRRRRLPAAGSTPANST